MKEKLKMHVRALIRPYIKFFFTGVTGVAINISVAWILTQFVFGVERYMIGYAIGTLANFCFNFALHTWMTFKTKKRHMRRFVYFVIYSILYVIVQLSIVRALTEEFGNHYYLIIIAGTILVLSFINFFVFKLSLFNEDKDS